MTHWCVWHDSFERVAWLIHTCDMTNLNVWHDSLIHVTWLIQTCGMTHAYTWHDSYKWTKQNLIDGWPMWCMCDTTHSCVRYDILIHASWRVIHTPINFKRQDASKCMAGLIKLCDMTYLCVWHDTHTHTHTHIHRINAGYGGVGGRAHMVVGNVIKDLVRRNKASV